MIDVKVLIDLALLGALVVGITAFNGIITNVLGMKLFGGSEVNRYTSKTALTRQGWRDVGGNSK
jgi:hypothetical protein